MDIYHYDPHTGELIATGQADPDPRRPGEYLIPAFATAEQPPALGNHQTAVFAGGTWQIVDDYRGSTWYRPDGAEYTVTDLGVVPDPADSATPPPPTVDQAKTAKLAALAAYRWERETEGVTIDGIVIKTDRESQAMINGARTYFDIYPDAVVDWKGANGWTQINRTIVSTITQTVGAHVQACFSRERIHAGAINALTTVTEIEAYDITTGWPSATG